MPAKRSQYGIWHGPYMAHLADVRSWYWAAYGPRRKEGETDDMPLKEVLALPDAASECFWIVPGTLVDENDGPATTV